ncbi:MAG: hypothetical protein R2787_10270 [Saprospiraceae bacterium]
MSGSSLDGVDLATVRFAHQPDPSPLHWTLLAGETIGFSQEWINMLKVPAVRISPWTSLAVMSGSATGLGGSSPIFPPASSGPLRTWLPLMGCLSLSLGGGRVLHQIGDGADRCTGLPVGSVTCAAGIWPTGARVHPWHRWPTDYCFPTMMPG